MRQIDFTPAGFRRAEIRRRIIVRCAMMLGVMGVGLAIWSKVSQQTVGRLSERLDDLNARVEVESKLTEEEARARARRYLQSDLRAIAPRLKAPVPATSIIAAAAETLPPATGMTKLTLTGEPVASEGNDERQNRRKEKTRTNLDGTAPVELLLEGIACDGVTIARLIANLDDHALFTDVQLGYSRPSEGGELIAREFQITTLIPLDRTIHVNDRSELTHAN